MGTLRVEPKVLARLTKLCLTFPEAETRQAEGTPHHGFLIGKKYFVYYTVDHHGDGRIALSVRAEKGVNAELVASDAKRFNLPKYMAHHGWVEYFLDLPARPIDWDEIAELVEDSYRIQAPKRALKLLDITS